ncbi:MAG TPA: TonB-dependent receptor plug domain-containing protein, partial [Methyloradius sp.]
MNEGFKALLKGTGLGAMSDQHGGYFLEKLPQTASDSLPAVELNLDDIKIHAKRSTDIGPMPGLSLTKEEIPGNVQSITAKQIKDAHSISLSDLMNSQLQSVNVNDYQGNPFQMDVTYRGFTASPQLGTPQGLSVFLDGIRVNEPFGDVVNWDMIPMNALAGMDVFPGSNPIFGLGTLGGALSMRTKNGFDDPGVQADMLTGAFGRKQFQLSAGGSHGDVAGFVALNLFDEDGWRQNSPSKVNQIFSKLSYRNDKLSLDGSMLYAWNDLVGNGLIPIEMYNQSNSSIFTSPDDTKNKLLQFQIASAFQVSDTFSITGQIYNRKSDRKSSTGDVNTDLGDRQTFATRRPLPGENPVCAYASTNGVPNFYVVNSTVYNNILNSHETSLASALADFVITTANLQGGLNGAGLDPASAPPPEYLAAIRQLNSDYIHGTNGATGGQYANDDFTQYYSNQLADGGTWTGFVGGGNFYTTQSGLTRYIIPADPLNGSCGSASIDSSTSKLVGGEIRVLDGNGNYITRNGAFAPGTTGTGTGYVDGTPTAIISDTEINQRGMGGAFQLNWNLDQHKFMVGASIDRATNSYGNSQRLGLLDASRNAYLDPANIGAEYAAATVGIRNNDFDGISNTRSLYFSETFSPKANLHFSAAARYNYT